MEMNEKKERTSENRRGREIGLSWESVIGNRRMETENDNESDDEGLRVIVCDVEQNTDGT